MKEKEKTKVLTHEEAIELLKNTEPLKIPKPKKRVERTCDNCADTIVCYGMNDPDDNEKAKTCPDWHLDYFVYEKLCDED